MPRGKRRKLDRRNMKGRDKNRWNRKAKKGGKMNRK